MDIAMGKIFLHKEAFFERINMLFLDRFLMFYGLKGRIESEGVA